MTIQLLNLQRKPDGRLIVHYKDERGQRSRQFKDRQSARVACSKRLLTPAALAAKAQDPANSQLLLEHWLALAVIERLDRA